MEYKHTKLLVKLTSSLVVTGITLLVFTSVRTLYLARDGSGGVRGQRAIQRRPFTRARIIKLSTMAIVGGLTNPFFAVRTVQSLPQTGFFRSASAHSCNCAVRWFDGKRVLSMGGTPSAFIESRTSRVPRFRMSP